MNNAKEIRLPSINDGDTFKISEMEFIKFPSADGMTPVVMKDIAFTATFGSNNNLAQSSIMRRLEDEILPKITAAIGSENVCTFKTDLTTLDGLKVYGEMDAQISLVTLDFYRANVEIFDKHNVDRWWWLATADSAPPHNSARWVLCVSPSGIIDSGNYNCGSGVRPFCILKSNIFVSK